MRPHQHPATLLYIEWLLQWDIANGDITPGPTSIKERKAQYLKDIEAECEQEIYEHPDQNHKVISYRCDSRAGECESQSLVVIYDELDQILTILQVFDGKTTTVYANGEFENIPEKKESA